MSLRATLAPDPLFRWAVSSNGDSIRLWSAPRGENGEGTHDELTLEVRPDGSYRIEAFREV